MEASKTLEPAEVFDDFGSATVVVHFNLQDDGDGGVFVLLVVVISATILLLQHRQHNTHFNKLSTNM